MKGMLANCIRCYKCTCPWKTQTTWYGTCISIINMQNIFAIKLNCLINAIVYFYHRLCTFTSALCIYFTKAPGTTESTRNNSYAENNRQWAATQHFYMACKIKKERYLLLNHMTNDIRLLLIYSTHWLRNWICEEDDKTISTKQNTRPKYLNTKSSIRRNTMLRKKIVS